MTLAAASPTRPRPATPLSWPVVVALHLGPGAALAASAALGGPVLAAAGLPRVWALLAGVLLVVVPLEGGLVLRHRARCRAAGEPVPPLLGRGTLSRRGALLAGAATFVAATALSGAAAAAEPALRAVLAPVLGPVLRALPAAGPGDLAAMGPAGSAVTVGLWLVAAVVVGPLTEEVYFRGFLQPRIPGRPLPGAAVGAALFAAYHLWQPAAALTVLAFALPVAVLVARTRAVGVGAAVHAAVNLVALAGLLSGVLSR